MRFLIVCCAVGAFGLLAGCGTSAPMQRPMNLTATHAVDANTPPSLETLHTDVQTALSSLHALETRVDTLDKQFLSLNLKPIQSKKTTTTKAVKPTVKSEMSVAAKAVSAVALRVGTHPDKVRLVFDLPQKMQADVALDAAEDLLTVSLPKANWGGAATKTFGANQPVISAYQTSQAGDDTRVLIALKGKTKIVSQSYLTNPNRLVIDLAR